MNIPQAIPGSRWNLLHEARNYRLIKQATHHTYRQWAACYPEWVIGFFDEHFVEHQVVPLLYASFHQGNAPDPAQLVERWANQFHLTPAQRQLRTSTLLPAAVDFLNRFTLALPSQQSQPSARLHTWLLALWQIIRLAPQVPTTGIGGVPCR